MIYLHFLLNFVCRFVSEKLIEMGLELPICECCCWTKKESKSTNQSSGNQSSSQSDYVITIRLEIDENDLQPLGISFFLFF